MTQVSQTDIANIFPFEQWNGDHHISAPNGMVEGEDYHVFAIVGGSAYKESSGRVPVDIIVPIGAVQLRLTGYINTLSWYIDITVYIKIPLLPEVILGTLKGDLKDGLTLTINLPNVIVGTLKLCVKDKDGRVWLFLVATLEIYNKKYELDIPVIPMPVL